MADPPGELHVFRPDDLLALKFRFLNLVLDGAPGAQVLGPPPGQVGFLTVEFPPQSTAEQAYSEGEQESTDARIGSVGMRPSGPSRLVFLVTERDGEITYTLAGLLDACKRLSIAVVGNFAAAAPTEFQTALELPYGVILSPRDDARWYHAAQPATSAGRTELWNTRLGRHVQPRPDPKSDPERTGFQGPRTLRAMWAGTDTVTRRHPAHSPPEPDFTTSLTDANRADLVAYGRDELVAALEFERLILSPLGAWVQARGSWPADNQAPPKGSLLGLTHRMTMGRDQFSRVVQKGFLYPFGHPAIFITITQRKLQRGADGIIGGYLCQRRFLVVQLAERDDLSGVQRSLPFSGIRLMTTITPNLAPPVAVMDGIDSEDAFWAMLDGAHDFLFRVTAKDHAGETVNFTTPMAFISSDVGHNPTLIAALNASSGPDGKLRRERRLAGQRVTFAVSGTDSTLETDSLELGADAVQAPPEARAFEPTMMSARARVAAVQAITGNDAPVQFTYREDYKKAAKNALDAYAEVTSAAQATFRPEQAGGLGNLEMSVTALSHTHGPLSGKIADTAQFDPKEIFGDGPKLFGTIVLSDLLESTGAFDAPAGQTAPRPAMPTVTSAGPATAHLHWSTTKLTRGPVAGIVTTDEGAELALDVTRGLSADGSVSMTSVGTLTKVSATLPVAEGKLALVRIPFERLEFTSEAGRKTDVSAIVGDIEFLGSLKFVETLAALIPSDGFKDPPALEVTPDGVTAGYTLAIPAAPFGVFNLQHLSFTAALHLPLALPTSNDPAVGKASMRLAFSERENPCLLTVSAFGGAAFIGLDLGFGGLNSLEGSLEFGGALALSIGVASGGVSVMAGVYYSYVKDRADALEAFLRVNGMLEVLGIVSISAQFYLSLRYSPPKLSGTASLTVKVRVLFVSKSVSMTVTREFHNSPAPTFADAMDAADWGQYLDAFAPDAKGAGA